MIRSTLRTRETTLRIVHTGRFPRNKHYNYNLVTMYSLGRRKLAPGRRVMDFFSHSLAKMTSWRFAQYPSNGLTVPRQSDPYQPRSVTDLAADEVRRSLHPLGEAERHEVCSVPDSVFRISCILTGTIGTLLRYTHTLSISIFSNSRLPSITHSYWCCRPPTRPPRRA